MDIRRYLDLETALSRKMRLAWRKQATNLYARMDGLMTQGRFDDARKLVDEIDFQALGEKYRGWIKAILWATAIFGAKQVGKNPMLAMGPNIPLMQHVTNNFILTMHYQITPKVREGILQSIAEREATSRGVITKAGLVTDDPSISNVSPGPSLFHNINLPAASSIVASQAVPLASVGGIGRFVQAFTSFLSSGDSRLQMVSSLNSSRLAAWGFLAEAGLEGVQTYKLQAVLDNRTSAFCREIDGEEFDVPQASYFIESALSAQDPADIKTLHPWPDQSKESISELQNMTREEMIARGYHVPPFHPNCRTILVKVRNEGPEEEGEEEDNRQAEYEGQQMQVLEDFTGLGINIKEEELDQWNRLAGLPPLKVLSNLTGKGEDELVDDPKKFFYFKKDGSMALKASGDLAGPETSVAVSQVFNPEQSKLFITQIDFNKASWAQTATATKALYVGALANAKAFKGKGVTLRTNGRYGLYSHAEFGFLPDTAVAWAQLRNDLMMDLSEDGRLAYLWTALPPEKAGALKLILSSPNPKGLWALAGLTYTVNGVPLGRVLLEDRELTVTLPTDDPEAMSRFEGYFQ